jgi:hypothetical protein
MKEQQDIPRQFPKVRRTSAKVEEISSRQKISLQTNPHRVVRYSGLQPEDQSYAGEVMSPRSLSQGDEIDEEDDVPDSYYSQRMPTSVRRYPIPNQEVYTQGNRRIVIHREPPPRRSIHFHWLVFVGVAMLVMLAGWVMLNMFGNWWQTKQDDWRYGNPRTYQTDAVVGHNDSASHPSHFIALNLNRHVVIIEIPGGDSSKARIYIGPTLFGDGQDLTPVTLSFQDLNGDGLPDMVVHIMDQSLVFINDSGQFKLQK